MKVRGTVHLLLSLTWLALAIPAILIWQESILFVIFASVYANVASEFAAYEATKGAREAADDSQVLAKLAQLEAKFEAALDRTSDK